MRGGVDGLLAEIAVAVVEEGDDRFVLLADQGDEVRLAVAVEVDDRDVDGAVARRPRTWGTNFGWSQSVVWFSR